MNGGAEIEPVLHPLLPFHSIPFHFYQLLFQNTIICSNFNEIFALKLHNGVLHIFDHR